MEFIDKCYIGGRWVSAKSGKICPVYNPASGEILGNIPFMEVEDTVEAIVAAEKALIKWRKTTGKERALILKKFNDLVISNRELLAVTMVKEQGKCINDARAEIDYTAAFIEWFGEEAKRIYGDIVPQVKSGQKLFTFKEPIGVVAAITPWNFPAAMIVRKIAPAIAAGCTMIVKPSEETPFTGLLLAKLAEEAGLPAGVLNIVLGDAAAIGDTLTANNTIKMLTFTGSTAVGKLLMEKCSKTVKKVTLELGGNAPFIIFEDANLDKALTGLVASKLRNGGQSCICVNRVFVHTSIFDQFVEKIKREFSKVRVGNGLDESVKLGPMINKNAVMKIHELVENAIINGSKVLYQAEINMLSECFYPPTIIESKNDQLLIAKDEIFGPVISLLRFDTEEEVIKRANATKYGLASYFYTENRERIWRVTEALEYGMVGVNDVLLSSEMASFGGVKESGIGREGGRTGILEYLEDKFIVMS
jgi:succinate-semialdehyde dehydrogenase/glutarate-semialdehyde dehydrogenase